MYKRQDYSNNDFYDEEGDLIPKAAMLITELEDGRRFAVRPSGTEPKIKYYLFGKASPQKDVQASKQNVNAQLGSLWEALEADANVRMSS